MDWSHWKIIMKYIIEKDNEGVRLDRYLRKKLKDTPLTEIFKALRIGKIKVNNKKKKENYRLVEGDKNLYRNWEI